MRKISLTTRLPAPADEVWDLLQRPATLLFVSRPLLDIRPIEAAFPKTWSEGDYPVSMRLLGILPLGRQTVCIRFEPAADGTRRIRDAGHGQLANTWDHLITVSPDGDGTLYSDEVTVDAGWLTLPVSVFARVFYAHRQRRWRKLLSRP